MRLQGVGIPAGSSSASAAAALRPAGANELRVAQMNLWNFFDPVDDPKNPSDGDADVTPTAEEYQIRLQKIAKAIVELGTPDLISVNEVENERVITDLLSRPELAGSSYRLVLQSLNDARGIRVGILYRGGKLEQVGEALSPNPKMWFADRGVGQIDRSLLYARPPLVVDFRVRGAAQAIEGAGLLTVAVNHFKSKRGGDERRSMQGQYLGEWLDARRATNPGGATIVLGDLNANYGEPAFEKLAKRADGTKRFHDSGLALTAADRYTYIYRGRKDMLDHVLVTSGFEDAITSVKILHVNSGDPHGSKWDPTVLAGFSDHDPIVTDFDIGKLLARRGTAPHSPVR